MTEKKKVRPAWVIPLWTGIAGSVIGGLLTAIVLTLWLKSVEGLTFEESVWRAIVTFAIATISLAAVLSFLLPSPRTSFAVTLFKRILSLRVLTPKKRDDLVAAGYDKRSREVEQERFEALRPQWRVRPVPGHPEWYMLYNSGYAVGNVRLNAPPETFTFPGAPAW